MDFKLLLKELYVYDPLKIWNTVQIQFAFYCFSQYAEKKIIDSFDDETNIEPFESLLELYETYLPKTLLKYLPELIENLSEFELLESFCLQLSKTLDISLETEDDLLQKSIANFVDNDRYNFFNKTIPTNELFYENDGELNTTIVESLLKNLNVEGEVLEVQDKEEIKQQQEEVKQQEELKQQQEQQQEQQEEVKEEKNHTVSYAFNIRKRTLRKKGIHNLTPMKSKTKRFHNKSLKNKKL